MNAVDPLRRYVVGSTGGRGPCDSCGVIAELHELVEEDLVANLKLGWWRPVRVVDLCLPCSFGAGRAPAPLQLVPAA